MKKLLNKRKSDKKKIFEIADTKSQKYFKQKKFLTQNKWKKKNFKHWSSKQIINWKYYHSTEFARYIFRYKKTRGKILWTKRWVRSNLFNWFKYHKGMHRLIKYTVRCHKKRSDYGNNRRISFFSNLQKLWWNVFMNIRQFANYHMRFALTPKWKKFRRFTGNFKLNYPQFQVWHLRKQKYWQKLRKRWIWHRVIKRSVKTKFLSNLKKYFAYNIAIRKYFKTILPSYELHKKVMYQQVPFFLVQMKLVPILKHAVKLCKAKRVMVNDNVAGPEYIIQPFDIIRFNFRKKEIFWKQLWHFNRRKEQKGFNLRHGLIYSKKLKLYIFYRNLQQLAGRRRISYLYYYYFYRNLLQTCRMQ